MTGRPHLVSRALLLGDLRRHVRGRPDALGKVRRVQVEDRGEPEIRELEAAVAGDEDVGSFYVSMHELVVVQKGQRRGELRTAKCPGGGRSSCCCFRCPINLPSLSSVFLWCLG